MSCKYFAHGNVIFVFTAWKFSCSSFGGLFRPWPFCNLQRHVTMRLTVPVCLTSAFSKATQPYHGLNP